LTLRHPLSRALPFSISSTQLFREIISFPEVNILPVGNKKLAVKGFIADPQQFNIRTETNVTKLLMQFQKMKFSKNRKVGNKNNNFRLK
jgi:hypothetical protein